MNAIDRYIAAMHGPAQQEVEHQQLRRMRAIQRDAHIAESNRLWLRPICRLAMFLRFPELALYEKFSEAVYVHELFKRDMAQHFDTDEGTHELMECRMCDTVLQGSPNMDSDTLRKTALSLGWLGWHDALCPDCMLNKREGGR